MLYLIEVVLFMISDDWSHIFPVWDLQHSLEELHFTYLTNTIFSFYVSPDDKNSNVWALQVRRECTENTENAENTENTQEYNTRVLNTLNF